MPRPLTVAAYAGAWLTLSLVAFVVVFGSSSREVTVFSHDATVRPTFSRTVVVHTGPVLPDVRLPSHAPIGLDVSLGKTDAGSLDELVERYAYLAGAPEGEEAKLRATVVDLAVGAALRAAALGALPLLVWAALGARRRAELAGRLPGRQGMAAVVTAGVVSVALWQPWTRTGDGAVAAESDWLSLQAFLGGAIALPAELRDVDVRGDVTTAETRRLIESAISTYGNSKVFYSAAAARAALLGPELRRPREGETVAVVVSDRHDNIGMDRVARAVADAAGATAVLDAGDDTSTGSSWEAFSLDSLDATFGDVDERWAVAGNHDNGAYVPGYLSDHGWTVLDGETVDGPGGSSLLGVPDPRASGLGNWRDEKGLSFAEVADRLADAACDSSERIATLLVHDANLGRPALERGCVDLVVGGHLHLQVGPTRVVGSNGRTGWSYTTGTTGGAAYAFALGSKPRREAEVSLVTYVDGRPAGIQSVRLETNGDLHVDAYVPLTS